ncbi:vacuolar protein sorting-associated protein 45 [Nematocida ausubeli]|nr:vacuolar protein sorting-associated protein 45 [Nematocida ausubeli]
MDTLLADIRSALSRGNGIKALLLDEFTRDSISPIISHAELLSCDFFLFEIIKNTRQPIDVSCVAILSKSSVDMLISEIQRQTYREYYIFITDELSDVEIEKIASNDSNGVIKELQELYFPGVPFDNDFIILNGSTPLEIIHSFSCLIKGLNLSLEIRYLFGSEVSYKCADFINQVHLGSERPANLLIMERSIDLFTPLQYAWTYQAMADEYLEYKAGMISWGDYNLCTSQDDRFFEECKFMDILYATERLKESFKMVKISRESVGEFISNVRHRAKESNRLTMHLKAITRISNLCPENSDVSEVIYDLIEGVEVSPLEDPSDSQRLRISIIEYLCTLTASKNIFMTMWKNQKKPVHLNNSYKNEIEEFSNKFVNPNISIRRPSFKKDMSRKLGYIPEVVRIVGELKKKRLSKKEFPVIRRMPGEKKTTLIFMHGGISFIEFRALKIFFAEEYPDEGILIITDRVIRANDVISAITPQKK